MNSFFVGDGTIEINDMFQGSNDWLQTKLELNNIFLKKHQNQQELFEVLKLFIFY